MLKSKCLCVHFILLCLGEVLLSVEGKGKIRGSKKERHVIESGRVPRMGVYMYMSIRM